MPAAAPRILDQLGYAYGYGEDGNGGPPLLEQLQWGAAPADGGRLGTAAPIFPRLESEAVDSG
jgi:hypothetical protein